MRISDWSSDVCSSDLGRGGPVLVEIPSDVMNEEIGDIDYAPVISTRYGPDPAELRRATEMLVNAKSPVIYAGQGVRYAKACPQVKQLAELLAIPDRKSTSLNSSH